MRSFIAKFGTLKQVTKLFLHCSVMKHNGHSTSDLRLLRRSLNLTLGEVAQQVGCSVATISLTERNLLFTPRMQQRWATRLANALQALEKQEA